MGIFGGRISEKGRDLDGGRRFDAFAPSHSEGSGLIGPGDAPRAFGAIAADALGGPKSFIPELGVANPSIANGEKHLASDSEDVKSMMRERR